MLNPFIPLSLYSSWVLLLLQRLLESFISFWLGLPLADSLFVCTAVPSVLDITVVTPYDSHIILKVRTFRFDITLCSSTVSPTFCSAIPLVSKESFPRQWFDNHRLKFHFSGFHFAGNFNGQDNRYQEIIGEQRRNLPSHELRSFSRGNAHF